MLEKDKRELAEELLWLRETSKAALQESWNEVEDLQCQCADHVDMETRLRAELTESFAGEENWRLRCLAAEEKLPTMPSDQESSHEDNLIKHPSIGSLHGISETSSLAAHNSMQPQQPQQPFEKNPLLSLRDKMRSWSSGNLQGMDKSAAHESKHSLDRDDAYYKAAEVKMQQILDSPEGAHHSSMSSAPSSPTGAPDDFFFIEEEVPVQTAGEISNPGQFYLHGNAKSHDDLSLIISSRDEIIESLERTLNQQLNNMQNLQGEMVCLMETQRIKEKRLSSTHKSKEERLDKLVTSLRGKLESNTKATNKQDKNLVDCKLYIQELADELERVLKIVKKAEEGGFLFK